MTDAIRQGVQAHIQPIQGFENARIVSVRPGFVQLALDVPDSMKNHYGIVHGGALFALCDMASGIAAYAYGQPNVTLDGSIRYIKGVRGGAITVTCTTLHKGRTTAVNRVEIRGDGDVLYAEASFTMFFTGDSVPET